jgi:1-acyl-sn-glycerol-3-phosphate acyltransferase
MLKPIRFVWFTFGKSLSYFLFVVGAIVLVTAVYPTICLFVHPAQRARRALRHSTSATFRLFHLFMWSMGLTTIRISREDRAKLKTLTSTVVVANHPSLLDITVLLSLIPNGDCIVNAKLFTIPVVRHVVSRLFIPNSLDFQEILDACGRSLDEGCCLVIFPEGSRTRPDRELKIWKGSARIALGTGHPILPVHIEPSDMRGLQKGDPFYRINRKGRYVYDLSLHEPLEPAAYEGKPIWISAREMTQDVRDRIFLVARDNPAAGPGAVPGER